MDETTMLLEVKPVFKVVLSAASYQSRFRAARLAGGYSLAVAGAAAGVSLQAVSQFERGQQGLQLAHFVAACAGLGISAAWVLTGRGEMFEGLRPVGGRKGGRRAVRH